MFLACPIGALDDELVPKRVGAAERRGVDLALEYLQNGPEAWLDDLADDFPWDSGSRSSQLELRAGPPQGARWRLATARNEGSAHFHILFPSGLEETLLIRFVDEGGELKVAAVQAGWENGKSIEPAGNAATPADAQTAAAPLGEGIGRQRALAAVLALASLLLPLLLRRSRYFKASCVASLALVGLALWLVWRPSVADTPPKSVKAPDLGGRVHTLQERLRWRRMLATGREQIAGVRSMPPEARLWLAEEALGRNLFDEARSLLADLPEGSGVIRSAAALRLRGRLAARRGDEGGVLRTYEELVQVWPDDEIYRVEAIESLASYRFGDQAAALMDDLELLRPRWPEAQLVLATQRAFEERTLISAESLGWAIQLGPVRRRDLIANPLAGMLMGSSSSLRKAISPDRRRLPEVECPRAAAGAQLAEPPGFEVEQVGISLFFRSAGGELEVPGGCELAPISTKVVAAESWLDERAARFANDAKKLTSELAVGEMTPERRRRLAVTIEGLMAVQNFSGILTLTDGLTPARLGELPDAARRARGRALAETGRRREAFDLMTELAASDVDTRRRDPVLLFELAEIMSRGRKYEQADRLYRAADRRMPFPASAQRRAQIKIEKKMIERGAILDRPPFRIYYPPNRGPRFAGDIADFLESERQRLSQLIPLRPDPRVIEVLLIDPEEFARSYGRGGVEILGLFDTMVRVPLGRIRGLDDFTAAILSHELAHALIADASGDRAPHWFHEGLAQMMEPGRNDLISISALHARGRWLAFPLVEAGLSGMATPELAQVGYEEALWSAIFLRERHGPQVFGRLTEAWRRGAKEEAGLRSATGLALEELDEQLIAWGLAEQSKFFKTEKARLPE